MSVEQHPDAWTAGRPAPRVERIRPVDDTHEVVTVVGGSSAYRRSPCGVCPWRIDQTGVFPAEAFAHSAETAYDQATHTFGCHKAGITTPVTCAGFLLRGADHNITIRLRRMSGEIDMSVVHDGGHLLHPSYRAMAIANGVHPDDPRLAPCREPVDL